jgi:hypothetical protein
MDPLYSLSPIMEKKEFVEFPLANSMDRIYIRIDDIIGLIDVETHTKILLAGDHSYTVCMIYDEVKKLIE